MILLLKGGLTTLDLFVDEMAKGNDAEVINLRDAKNAINRLYELDPDIDETTTVITFNNVGASLKMGERSYWRMKNVKFINILVDHPVYYIHDIVNNFTANTYVYTIDKGHMKFLNEIFPNLSEHFRFIPHGGADINGMCCNERPIDVLYVGSFKDEDQVNFAPIGFLDSEAFYEFCLEYYATQECVEAHEAVWAFQKEYDLKLSAEQVIVLTDAIMASVERFYTGSRRKEMILSLADSGIHVTVGGGKEWEEVEKQNPEFVHYIGMVSPENCLKLISQTKVLLNDLPYFAYGAHERIFNGALNGAVVMSNSSEYLKERFAESEDILFWDMKDYDFLVQKVCDVLNDDDMRRQIAQNAYDNVKADSWSERFRTIMSEVGN